jgi:hypothetical protein
MPPGYLRVQRINRGGGRRSWTIVWPEGAEHREADRFLRRHDGSGTQRTYAHLLVDHLRWLQRELPGRCTREPEGDEKLVEHDRRIVADATCEQRFRRNLSTSE